MRASIRQLTAFSSRESVGCEASPILACGRLSQAIFKAGSWRSASRSSQSSCPQAMAIIRAWIMVSYEWTTRDGSRASAMQDASSALSPRERPASRSSSAPPFEEMAPPSNFA